MKHNHETTMNAVALSVQGELPAPPLSNHPRAEWEGVDLYLALLRKETSVYCQSQRWEQLVDIYCGDLRAVYKKSSAGETKAT